MKRRWNQWLREAKIEHIKSYPYIITPYSSVQLSFAVTIFASVPVIPTTSILESTSYR
jgi:hypothetical protein